MSDYYPSPCPLCGEMKHDIARRHQSTAYVNEESNYLTSCLECFERAEEYWKEMWAEYNSGRL